ncbi:uncharacterized protein LOC127002580, partial [Eriocheir sinensis]|uniref:uncharacterized protein LOC127002580 n=1 Tax=Eriocheir sinensis TaxID=95602 RepID=UPI0021CA0380
YFFSFAEAGCKEKWGNLRSNFMREKRKISAKPSGSANTQARKWVYYDAMTFIIPHVTPRASSSNVRTPPHQDTYHDTEDEPQNHSPCSVVEASGNATPDEAASNIEICENSSTVKPMLPILKKPTATKKLKKETEEEMDMRFLNELKLLREQTLPQDNNDSDRHFLLSLLPMVKQLSPMDNLDFRIEMQESLRRKIYKPESSVQYGYWTQQNQLHTPTPSPSPGTSSGSDTNNTYFRL